MKTTHNLSNLPWTVAGFHPHQWRFEESLGMEIALRAEIPPVPALVPGSVQMALRRAGILPDWNVGLNARQCEWVENRHWMYETTIPARWIEVGRNVRLRCLGLDYGGCVRVDGKEIGSFKGSFTPHVFDLTPHVAAKDFRLQIIFEDNPGWLGQYGYTSRMTEWKPRFNYTWDWVSRLVQIGIWDVITIEVTDGIEIADARCVADGNTLTVSATAPEPMELTLADGDKVLRREKFTGIVTWRDLPVQSWWPNGYGAQPLYTVTCRLGNHDVRTWRVGFKTLRWERCEGAPSDADPWLCVVNGKRTFVQGVNWTPIRPNFADVTATDVEKRVTLYRDLGCNILRVWGGAYLERENFYELCDAMGLLVWQEFPLSSSGLDNWPPENPGAIEEMATIARSYIVRRQHHVSLALWCGGNELQGDLQGRPTGVGKPVDNSHPMMARLKKIVGELDPQRRFLPSSSSGPRFMADKADYGKGLHWDIHGPWNAVGPLEGEWSEYWAKDDALFRSETGCPGTSPVDLIRQYAGECVVMPPSLANPLWRRSGWWIQWDDFLGERKREPKTLDEFVAWSQERQKRALTIAVGSAKRRFPKIGGIILWMGHDSFPCTANTSIVDFHGNPKPAADVFRLA